MQLRENNNSAPKTKELHDKIKSTTIAKNQHYIWQYYLNAWKIPDSNQIFCLRNGTKLFKTSTENVGVKRYFYAYPVFSGIDLEIINIFANGLISKSENAKINELIRDIVGFYTRRNEHMKYMEHRKESYTWIRDYIGTNDELEDLISSQENNANNYKNEGLEIRYRHAEESGINALKLLQNNDLSFWNDNNEREKFLYFLMNQYFRTKGMRDRMSEGLKTRIVDFRSITEINGETQINWDGIAQVIIDLVEADWASYLFHDKTVKLLNNNTDVPFITGDQPVVNLSADYDKGGISDDFIPYYPITPWTAIVIVDSENIIDETASECTVNYLNITIKKASYEQVYANEINVLRRLVEG